MQIKKHVEKYADTFLIRAKSSQLRRCKELQRDSSIIEGLYSKTDDDFVKVVIEIFKTVGLEASYIGDIGKHKVDGIIKTEKGVIVIEGNENSKVLFRLQRQKKF